MRKQHRFLRSALAAVLACGLMVPTTAATAYADGENTPTPLSSESSSGEGAFDGPLADTDTTAAEVMATPGADADAPREGQAAGGFTVVGGKTASSLTAKDGDYFFDGSILHILTSVPLTLSTEATTANTIQVEPGVKADLTLAGVSIESSTAAPINLVNNVNDTPTKARATSADQILNKTTLYLTLADGSDNQLRNTNTTAGSGLPGIRCGWGSVLVIDDAVTNVRAGGSKFNPADFLVPENGLVAEDATLLNGSTVNAGDALGALDAKNPGKLLTHGGSTAASIGSAVKEHAGDITINGGDLTIQVWYKYDGNASGGAGIGAGNGGSATNITINGGTVDTTGGCCGAAIGASYASPNNAQSGTAPSDAIAMPTTGMALNPASDNPYGWFGSVPTNYYPSTCNSKGATGYHMMAGDIAINGGFVNAKGSQHGNAIGQGCAHGANSNSNHVIRITGGTVLTSVYSTTSVDPKMYSIGGLKGYTIITGGSVYVTSIKEFQGIGDTAFNTQGITNWDDVKRVAGGDPNDPVVSNRKYLPDTDKVFMITVNLKNSDEKLTNEKIEKFKLYIANDSYDYGAPARFDDGKLYLWLPEWVAEKDNEKEVRIEMSVRKGNEVVDIDPLFIAKPDAANPDQTVKRYIEFDFPADYQKSLEKNYDGLPFPKLVVNTSSPITITRPQGDTTITETLNVEGDVKFKYQMLKQADDGSWVPDGQESAEGEAALPSDTGRFAVTMTSYQYAKDENYKDSYWGHQAKGTAIIKPVPAVLKIAEKDGTAWVRLKKQADDSYDYELVKETDKDPGTHLRVAFTVRSAKGTAVTCKAPTGKFQVLIDGKPVGEPVPLTEEAMEKAPGSSLTIKEGAKEKDENTSAAIAGEANRWETQVEYFLDPTNLDGALDVLGTSGQGNTHEVTVRYIPDKNYVEGTEESPEDEKTEASKPTTIVPVKPEGTVEPEDPDKVEIEDTPNPAPGPDGTDPDNPTGKMQVVRKTINVSYGDFHKADAEVDDFFKMAITSNSSAPGGFTTSNTAVADLVRGDDGNPVLDEDGKLQIQVNSCGTSVITLEQKANALFTGIKYILTVNVTPDPSLKPQIQIRLTWRNLTALGETSPEPAAALIARGLAALAAGESEAFAASTRTAPDRASTPPRPGDVIEYTVTGLNLTPGSAWQAAELKDAIDARLAFDAQSVEIASNYATHSDKYDLGTAAFYNGFNWDGLGWADVKPSDFSYVAPTLTKGIGTVYGGQSTSVRFRATVGENEGLGDRPEDGKLPEITNEPGGLGRLRQGRGRSRPRRGSRASGGPRARRGHRRGGHGRQGSRYGQVPAGRAYAGASQGPRRGRHPDHGHGGAEGAHRGARRRPLHGGRRPRSDGNLHEHRTGFQARRCRHQGHPARGHRAQARHHQARRCRGQRPRRARQRLRPQDRHHRRERGRPLRRREREARLRCGSDLNKRDARSE